MHKVSTAMHLPFSHVNANWIAFPPTPQNASTITLERPCHSRRLVTSYPTTRTHRQSLTSFCNLNSNGLGRHRVPPFEVHLTALVEPREKTISLVPVWRVSSLIRILLARQGGRWDIHFVSSGGRLSSV
jgi:hypothetical protein